MAKITQQSPGRTSTKLKENEKERKPVSTCPTARCCRTPEDVSSRAEQRAAPEGPVWNKKDPALGRAILKGTGRDSRVF